MNRPLLKFKKKLQLIPNLFTLGNAFFGFCSIKFAAEGEFYAAAYCIFLGAMMDSLDGQIARMMRSTSEFGLQLDSLCDAITFCLAPAFLVYSWQLYKFGFLGAFCSAVLLLCGVLRLAKFNITASSQTHYFIGVPTPIAACFIAAVVLNFGGSGLHFVGRLFFASLVWLISMLMVSTVRVPTFKHIRKGWYAVAFAGIASAAMVFSLVKTLLIIFSIYFIFVLGKSVYFYISRKASGSVKASLEESEILHPSFPSK
jgi:CDP-diacylglycerol--serine O-phosphatidyltransferase